MRRLSRRGSTAAQHVEVVAIVEKGRSCPCGGPSHLSETGRPVCGRLNQRHRRRQKLGRARSLPTMRFFARRAICCGLPEAIASMSSTRRAARKSFEDNLGRLMRLAALEEHVHGPTRQETAPLHAGRYESPSLFGRLRENPLDNLSRILRFESATHFHRLDAVLGHSCNPSPARPSRNCKPPIPNTQSALGRGFNSRRLRQVELHF